MKTLNHPFFLDMKRGAEESASKLGIELVVQAAERELDVEKQTQIIENVIQTGVRALCVTPSGSKEVASVLAKATQRGSLSWSPTPASILARPRRLASSS